MATILTQGTTITVEDELTAAQTIGGHVSITGLASGAATEIDTTNLASTAKEFRQGLQDNGSFTLEVNRDYDDVGQAELIAMRAAQAARPFVITLPEGTTNTISFTGFCTSFTSDINADGIVTGSATIRISGDVTYA
jgi:hypothetical protein